MYFKARSYTKQLESGMPGALLAGDSGGQIGNLLEHTDAKMAVGSRSELVIAGSM